jgi:hypothetical protein
LGKRKGFMGPGKSHQKKQASKGTGPAKYGTTERRRSRRFFFVWLPIIVIAVLFFYAFVFDPPKPFGQPIPGIAREGDQTRPGDITGNPFVVVLDDGRMVKLVEPQMGSLEANRRLLVQENVTLVFKRKSFSFVRYIE